MRRPLTVVRAVTAGDPPHMPGRSVLAAARPAGLGDWWTGLGDWWAGYQRDPIGTLTRLLHAVTRAAATWAPLALPGLAVAVTAVVLGAGWLGRRRRERMTAGARLITVLPPPEVDPAGGEALWANLVGLLRPPWRRLLVGQPHLGFEYVFSETGVKLQVWVPGVIPPDLVEQAIHAAWPGAHTTTTPATPPLPLTPVTISGDTGSDTGSDTDPHTPVSSDDASDEVSDGVPAGGAPQTIAAGRRLVVVGGQLRLGRSEALPIRTKFDTDPLRGMLGAPVGLGPGEHACVQILARPVTGRRVIRARRAARTAAAGTGGSPHPGGLLLDLGIEMLTGNFARSRRSTSTRAPLDPQTAMETTAVNRAIVGKQRGSQYATVIHYAVTTTVTPRPTRAATHAAVEAAGQVARGRAHALAAAFAAYTEHNRYSRTRLPDPAPTMAERRLGRGDLLSVPELAAIAHLPTDAHIPGLARAGAQAVAPPPGTPRPRAGVLRLGVTDTAPQRPVGLRIIDARHHLHVLGATGSGKSTLLAHLILDNIAQGIGGVLIDPKGDLVTDLLARLPAPVADRVVLLDADSPTRPPCLNPLDPATTMTCTAAGETGGGSGGGTESGGEAGGQRLATELVVDNVVSVFARIYSATWGPRTDDVLRAACLTLLQSHEVTTLADIPGLLTDPVVRARRVETVTDPVLQGFWDWYDALTDAGRAQVIAPLLNKLRAFLLRPFARDALAGGPADLDMNAVLDGGQILLVRIPQGRLGDETCRLIGSLVVARAWQAVTARAAQPQHVRRDAWLVMDECHKFLNLPYPMQDMLAEARGFRLAMTLAHQNLGQLTRDLREGIATNARSKVFFTSGPDDAHDLARHTVPRLTEHDISHLGKYHAAARLVVDEEQTPAFTLRTEPLPAPVPGRARFLRAHAARSRPDLPRPTPTPPDNGADPRFDDA